jgi:BlaI family transcriptional regulator, penicillinase repressor
MHSNISMHIKPTDAELEILNFLWKNGPGTVRDVHNHISAKKPVGYTTSLKLMQIMHDKGLLYRTGQGKSHIYVALLGKEETRHQLLVRLIDSAFQGSADELLIQLLHAYPISNEALAEIKILIDNQEVAAS